MAKPGSDEARELSKMAEMATPIDGTMPDLLKAQITEQVLGQLGVLCGGCRRKIKVGFQFTLVDVAIEGGRPVADIRHLSACDRDDCDFAERCKDQATFIQMIEYAWLDEVTDERPDTPMDYLGDPLAKAEPERAPEAGDGIGRVEAGEEFPDAATGERSEPEGERLEDVVPTARVVDEEKFRDAS